MPPSRDISRLIEIMAALRTPVTGCPWDVEQTFQTIAPYTIEEAYEVADAIDRGDLPGLCDELGDLLLQVVFHAQMADEKGMFDFADCAAAISDKLVFRHPHVFGDESRDKSAAQQVKDWEAIKAVERAGTFDYHNDVDTIVDELLETEYVGTTGTIVFGEPDSDISVVQTSRTKSVWEPSSGEDSEESGD